MTTLYFHFFNEQLPGHVFENKLRLFTPEQSSKVKNFMRWQDAEASLIGKLLLLKGFNEFDIGASLHDLKYNAYGKPYLHNANISFNISHSGDCVVCIVSNDTSEIGVDVEEIRPVNITDFTTIWTTSEWKEIQENSKGKDAETFFRYWTRKEALIKADGKGLSIPLDSVSIQDKLIGFQDRTFYIEDIDLAPKVAASVASVSRIGQIKMVNVLTF